MINWWDIGLHSTRKYYSIDISMKSSPLPVNCSKFNLAFVQRWRFWAGVIFIETQMLWNRASGFVVASERSPADLLAHYDKQGILGTYSYSDTLWTISFEFHLIWFLGRRLNYTDIIPLSDYIDMFDMAAYRIENRHAHGPEVTNPDASYHHKVTGGWREWESIIIEKLWTFY